MPKDVMEEVDRLMRAMLLRAQSLDDYRDEGGGERGGIAVLLPSPSTDTRACNVGVESEPKIQQPTR